ncbi:helix-turn-helix domain-containing protein [Paenibacillus sp. MBLB4367]|uniref:helix-turn-helix domain-containing protein n=1 Tax=Paenibacillus sp. MBLB4367 TaxID=3384767 RepID=UPI0039081446
MNHPVYLTEYPNMHSTFPFSIKTERIEGIFRHRHDFLEFIFVLEGQGVQIVNGIRHSLQPGTLVFLLPYQFHEITCEAGRHLKLFICNFDLELLFHSKEGDWGLAAIVLEDSAGLPPYVQPEERDKMRMDEIFGEMMREYEGNDRMRPIMIKAKLLEALVLFDRFRYRQHANGLEEGSNGNRELGKRNFWQVIRYVHLHYREEMTLDHLAGIFHYNASHLSELFKIRIGQTFVHFLQGLRIRHACGLLSSTELSVAAIAYEVGFGSFQTFSRTFLKIKGIQPTAYRKRSRA